MTLAGVTIRRVCLPELAARLVHAGYNETAATHRLFEAPYQVDLTAQERAEILAVIHTDTPEGLRSCGIPSRET